jgi:hypothetical protein
VSCPHAPAHDRARARRPGPPGETSGTTRFNNMGRRSTGRRASVNLVTVLAALVVATTQLPDALPEQPPSPPTSRRTAGGRRPFQPGVSIDWSAPAVYVDGHVVLRAGPIEFLACFAGKEHESIVRLDASAAHIYMALGLIGLEPGHPPEWDEQRGRFGPPAGDLVDVRIEWEDDGGTHTAGGFEWLREFEFGRTPIARPWVFTGSRRLDDGSLSADHSGEGIAVVDKPESLLALSRNHVSHDAELWAAANAAAIPPPPTPVRIVLYPAPARTHEIGLDFRGAAFVDRRYAQPEDVADLIKLACQMSPQYVQTIWAADTRRADVVRFKAALAAAGVPAHAVSFKSGTPPTTLPASGRH